MLLNSTVELRDLPAPRGLPVVGNLFQLNQERIHLTLEKWARQHGPFYRLRIVTQETLILSDPEGIMQVLKQRPDTFSRSKTLESVMEEMGVTGVVTAEGERWKRQSRLMMQAFDPAHLRSFFPEVVKVTKRLLKRWQQTALNSRAIDIQNDLMRYAMDVTAGLAFGRDINTLDGDNDVVRHLDRIFPMIHRRINSLIPYWRYLKLPADRSFDRDLAALHQAIDQFIAQARERMKANPLLRAHPANFIEALVAARDQPDSGFTDEDVFGNVFSTLLAGGDGTANMIAWIVYFLCEHPEWQLKLQQEVDPLLADQDLILDFDQLSASFPNIEAVIQETMRLKTVFPLLLHEAKCATQIGHVRVPAGTVIVLMMRMAGLDPKNFPHSDRFEPTRWMPSAIGEDPAAHRIAYLPFGSGPRMCPGRLLAMQELKMVITLLVRHFTVERLGPSPVEERIKFTMEPINLHVRLKER